MRKLCFSCLAALLAFGFGVGGFGCGSEGPEGPPPPPPDTTPPRVTQATATRLHRIEITFDERVDRASAENPSNYAVVEANPAPRLSGGAPEDLSAPGDTLGVQSASLQPGGKTVVLTTDPMGSGLSYDLFVTGVEDLAGNGIGSATTAVVDDIKSGKIYTIAGTGVAALGKENVDPLASELYLPQDMTVGPDGNLYIVDWNNHRIRVIKDGRIRTIIGTGFLGDADPGTGTAVELNHPTHVSFDDRGRMFMAAWHNSKVMVYDLATRFCDVYAGKLGRRCWAGDGGPAFDATLNLPSASVIGPDGALYVADQGNFCIRRIDAQTGVIGTVVARSRCDETRQCISPVTTCSPGFCGDEGPAVDACLRADTGQNASPTSRIEFDSAGNLYIADTGNHRVRVVDTSGIIHAFAGNGVPGHSGDEGDATAAQVNYPTDVAIGPDGSVYIADKDNHCVRMVDAGGVIRTVAGKGRAPGYGGDGGSPTDALLNQPFGIHVDQNGDLYIADTLNHRIRVVYK